MHTAISAPTVDDAPRLRIGTMLIEYPLAALKKAIQGLVIVRFTVETDGRAYGINVVSGLGPECDAAVVSALRDARFIPGSYDGRRVPALSQIAVHFKIVDGSPWP
jgi:TonB family protein